MRSAVAACVMQGRYGGQPSRETRAKAGPRPDGATLDQAIGFAVETLKRGAELAGARGLILGLEDDGGITDYAKETIEIVKRTDSPWAGMNLDIGNFRPPAVYEQIEMSIPYAVSTHVKTTVALDDGKTPGTGRLRSRLQDVRGPRLPRLHGPGVYEADDDPATAVPAYLRRLKELAVRVLQLMMVLTWRGKKAVRQAKPGARISMPVGLPP